ncbi:GNAT family N-acetyltransferase [Pseudoalteromonas mariniglutinosa]|uniref:GNAT family N-acetyltransferase n=1 Tax=Pseudoalteromonas mariniglutinosa TaxID=206042 RepID=UPI0038513D00
MEISIDHEIALKTLTLFHAAEVYQGIMHSSESLEQYLPWVKNVINKGSAVQYIEQRINSGKAGAMWYAVYIKQQFSGIFAVKEVDPLNAVAEIGYWLVESARGKRVVARILAKMLPYLYRHNVVKYVEFHCLEENLASINVAQRAGATFQYYLSSSIEIANKVQRLGVYKLDLTNIQGND